MAVQSFQSSPSLSTFLYLDFSCVFGEVTHRKRPSIKPAWVQLKRYCPYGSTLGNSDPNPTFCESNKYIQGAANHVVCTMTFSGHLFPLREPDFNQLCGALGVMLQDAFGPDCLKSSGGVINPKKDPLRVDIDNKVVEINLTDLVRSLLTLSF